MTGHWRDSARTPQFFFIDSTAAFPMVLLILHLRLWTFILAVAATLFFTMLKRFGFSPIIFLRWIRNLLAGNRKLAKAWWQ